MPLLRTCSNALATALQGGVLLDEADIVTLVLQSSTTYRLTSWDVDLVVSGQTYVSSKQYVSRGQWRVTNTMEVPTLEMRILDAGTFVFGAGTTSLLNQAHNGLLDGASLELQRVFLPFGTSDTTTYGTVDLFIGDMGAVTISGQTVTMKVRGANTRLDVNAPRNVYQQTCIHDFCDTGCTLNPASFTTSFTAALGSTRTTVALNVTSAPALVQGGKLTFTSGVNAGLSRGILGQRTLGLDIDLTYPLPAAPAVGDSLTIFAGCDKTLATCNVYNNKNNFRAFPYMPPPQRMSPGQ